MSSADVCAVIHAGAPDPIALEVLSAVGVQRRRPRVVLAASTTLALPAASTDAQPYVAGARESVLLAGVHAGQSCDARWVWLLDGYAVPEPGALEAMLGATEIVTPPAPVLLASKVVDRHGRLHPDSTPRHQILAREQSVYAAERHLVQLRAAAPGSVLVDRAAIDRFGPPRADLPPGLDMLEWSARMLRAPDHSGYLVPTSVALRVTPPTATSWRDFPSRLRVLGSSAWTPREKLQEAFTLCMEVAGATAPGITDGRAWGRQASSRRADRGG